MNLEPEDIPPDLDGDGDADERRRDNPIGRRRQDIIRAQVREEIRRLRLRWLAVWAITLFFSAFAWHTAERNSDRSDSALRASRAGVSQVFCEAINGNAAASNAQTDFLRALVIQTTQASRPFEKVYRQFGLPDYRERMRQARQTAHALEERKVPVLPCREFVKAINKDARKLPKPTPPPRVDPSKIKAPGSK